MEDERVDATDDIVNGGITREGNLAGFGIDFDLADGTTVGEYRIVHLVVGDHRDPAFQLLRKVVSSGLLGELEKVEGAVCLARAEPSVGEFALVRRRLKDCGRDFLALRNEIGQCLREQRCGMPHGAAVMRSSVNLYH